MERKYKTIAQKLKRYEKLFNFVSQPISQSSIEMKKKKRNFHASMLNVKHTATPTMTATSAIATAATQHTQIKKEIPRNRKHTRTDTRTCAYAGM